LNINQLLRIVSREFSEINNLFLHINYNALYQIISVDLLTREDVKLVKLIQVVIVVNLLCIIIGINQLLRKLIKDFKIIDKYNPNTVIDAQVVAAGGWSKYKGQILHLNSDFSELYSK
jgi:hypothetical protein